MKVYRVLFLTIFIFLNALIVSACTSCSPTKTSLPIETLTSTPRPTITQTVTSTPNFNVTLEPFIMPTFTLNVAYVDSSNNLWIWSTDGTEKQLTVSGDVIRSYLSDDSKLILFFRGENSESPQSIWVINVDGSNERLLISSEALNPNHDPEELWIVPLQVAWVPSMHKVFFNTYLRPNSEFTPQMDLWLLDADLGSYQKLLPSGDGGLMFFSPDGRKIALVDYDSLSTIDSDGTSYVKDIFSWEIVPVGRSTPTLIEPVWTETSESIIVAIPLDSPETSYPVTYSIYQIFLDGFHFINIVDIQATFESVYISPDTQRILYSIFENVGSSREKSVWVKELDTNVDTKVLSGIFWFNAWNPNSSGFVYSMQSDDITINGYLDITDGMKLPLTEYPYINTLWFSDIINENYFLFTVSIDSTIELRLGKIGSESFLIKEMPYPNNYWWFDIPFSYAK